MARADLTWVLVVTGWTASLSGTPALGEGSEPRLRKVEGVLDRLEKYLLDHQSDPLTFDERKPPERPVGKVSEYSYVEEKIVGQAPSTKQLDAIARTTARLESEIDLLESEVHRARQSMVEQSGLRNVVQIETEVVGQDATFLRSLVLKLDGHVVWEGGDAGGIWVTTPKFGVFRGPMFPGDHRLAVEARIAQTRAQGLPLQESSFVTVQKEFEIQVPQGDGRLAWVLRVSSGGDSGAPTVEWVREGTS